MKTPMRDDQKYRKPRAWTFYALALIALANGLTIRPACKCPGVQELCMRVGFAACSFVIFSILWMAVLYGYRAIWLLFQGRR